MHPLLLVSTTPQNMSQIQTYTPGKFRCILGARAYVFLRGTSLLLRAPDCVTYIIDSLSFISTWTPQRGAQMALLSLRRRADARVLSERTLLL